MRLEPLAPSTGSAVSLSASALAVANIFPSGIALLGQAVHAERFFIDEKMYKTTSQDVINGAVLTISISPPIRRGGLKCFNDYLKSSVSRERERSQYANCILGEKDAQRAFMTCKLFFRIKRASLMQKCHRYLTHFSCHSERKNYHIKHHHG